MKAMDFWVRVGRASTASKLGAAGPLRTQDFTAVGDSV